ncbi:peptidase inhibitor family I36 protein [Streptomyces abikoensis]|uniref:peptidase inhibitor family I36 protein n=1 Tax=Streptomyces abikoensis TaxID=97398 RepID=UPI0036B9571D
MSHSGNNSRHMKHMCYIYGPMHVSVGGETSSWPSQEGRMRALKKIAITSACIAAFAAPTAGTPAYADSSCDTALCTWTQRDFEGKQSWSGGVYGVCYHDQTVRSAKITNGKWYTFYSGSNCNGSSFSIKGSMPNAESYGWTPHSYKLQGS